MERKTGVVVPLAALYTKDCPAIGDFLALKSFADFCTRCNLSIIQLLPVNDTGTQSSPYSGLSAFALHPLYIRIDALPEFEDAYQNDKAFAGAWRTFQKECKYRTRFDYEKVLAEKTRLLHLMYAWIEKQLSPSAKKTASRAKVKEVTAKSNADFPAQFAAQTERFIRENKWIVSYAVYKNLKDAHGQASWKEWPENLQKLTREQIQMRWNNRALKSSHTFFVWCQLRAAEQFGEAAEYVRSKGIVLKGDIPILMNEDSADAWAWPEFFNHSLRAGSPPDGENPLGQNWGFPTYDWEHLATDGYTWWKDRVQAAARYYDAFRIDHVLGFFRIWAVPHDETTAFLGHTVPCQTIARRTFAEHGFDNERLRWLSEPHIPTGLIENITWNHDEAVSVLEAVCERLGSEELWNFKNTITADSQLYAMHFFDDEAKDARVKEALAAKWRDRMLLELSKDMFVPVYQFRDSTAWKTLSAQERQALCDIFKIHDAAENELWKKQALSVLRPIVSATGMAACAEDLGAGLSAVPEVLCELGILSLRVFRWNRFWSKDGQPFVPFADYPALSVATTSVHDSSTLRQWWQDEPQSVKAFLDMFNNAEKNESAPCKPEDTFSPDVALFCLEAIADTASCWYINPLQDYLYLDSRYYLENPQDERINVPGSVNTFNWTYRLPVLLEDLSANEVLVTRIKTIVRKHDCAAV